MTEIEKKALALVNEADATGYSWVIDEVLANVVFNALCRAIEQHEAYKQEVSDAVESYFCGVCPPHYILAHLIIPKPTVDPLVEAWIEATGNTVGMEPLNEALAKRGFKIVEDV